jgi:molybdopterin-guanine dinucleotide biosynthesis protein A
MGRDKVWIEVAGQPLLRLGIDKIKSLGPEEMFISGRAGEDYSRFDCRVLHDLEPGFGPMGGIERGLHEATTPLVLVLAVDLPNMTPEFLGRLLNACDRRTGVVPTLAGGLEPLAAVYSKRCHAYAATALANGRRSARDFALACLNEQAVRPFAVAPEDARCFANWNCPSDLVEHPAVI